MKVSELHTLLDVYLEFNEDCDIRVLSSYTITMLKRNADGSLGIQVTLDKNQKKEGQ